MGEAKRRRELAVPTVYHHTSTLRTNLLWMSGVIEVEGQGRPALHPTLGEIAQTANLRRAFDDFPPLAWFTTQINPPRCITEAAIIFTDKTTGEPRDIPLMPGAANAIALHRVAIGFPIASIDVVRWADHPGYATAEGRALNDSAREFRDNPDDWYVAERPVDLMLASEIWTARSVMKPKLERAEPYLREMKRMVDLCRTTEGAFIPPTWVKPEDVHRLAERMGLPVA